MLSSILTPEISAYTQRSGDALLPENHFHVFHELILIEEGQVSFHIGEKEYIAGPGSLVIIGNLEKHDLQILSCPYCRHVLLLPGEFCLHSVREPRLASIFLYRPAAFRHVLQLDPQVFPQVKKYFLDFISESKDQPDMWQLRCQLLLESLLLLIYRSHPDSFHWESAHGVGTVFRVQRYIAEHFSEPLTLTGLAQEFFISQYHLSRLFKSITGYGVQTYLQLCRINEAKRLLQHTNLSINNICFSVGYKDVNHFIRLFRLQEGTTPLQFRKNVQK